MNELLRAFDMIIDTDCDGNLVFTPDGQDGFCVLLLKDGTSLEISERNGRIVRTVVQSNKGQNDGRQKNRPDRTSPSGSVAVGDGESASESDVMKDRPIC